MNYKNLWISFIAVLVISFAGLGYMGVEIYQQSPPIYAGLESTQVHGHAALFGVYGMLGIGLTLFALKGLSAKKEWKNGAIRYAFWTLNIGLALMVLISALPVGLGQTLASVEKGLWFARSAEFLQSPTMLTFKWQRVIGDVIFSSGVVSLVYFIIGLKTGWSLKQESKTSVDQYKKPVLDELEFKNV